MGITTKKSSKSAKPAPHRERLDKLAAFVEQHRHNYATYAELATAANISPATLSLFLKRKQAVPSTRILTRLAKALCPQGRRLEEFTQEMLRLAGKSASAKAAISAASSETVFDRVTRNGGIRVGYVLGNSFVVAGGQSGFAIELFRDVVKILGLRVIEWKEYTLSELRSALEFGEVDIVVSAILPTFQRSQFMAFSKPFPYMRLSLTALARRGAVIKDKPLCVDHVLDWADPDSDYLAPTRLLLVKGEAGHEFADTFLGGIRESGLVEIEFVESFDARLIGQAMLHHNPQLFLAGLATCAAVYRQEQIRNLYEPLKDPDADPEILHLGIKDNFPTLAIYPLAFGLPKEKDGEARWQNLVNGALDSLMGAGGVRVLYALYQK